MPEHDADLIGDEGDERDDAGAVAPAGVGLRDPNIVGDAGPVDVAPGSDGGGLIVEGPADKVEL